MAARVVEATLRQMPAPLRSRACQVPVSYESRANPGLQREGIEADTLGLFVGESFAEVGNSTEPLPAQILMFLDSLWEYVQGDTERFRVEVRKTYLHELGHYLGLDEEDLQERDLD